MKALLAPASFNEMYHVASKGYHSVLQRAIDRGLNIDSVDEYGNTGLCVAIYRRDCTAYNSFAAVGANRHHYCVSQIPTEQYESFMNSGCVAPFLFGEKPMVAEENSRKLALFWIFIGVAAVTGAVIALRGSSGSSSTVDTPIDDDNFGGSDNPGGSGGDDNTGGDGDNTGGGGDDDNPGGGGNSGGDGDDDNPGGGDNPGGDDDDYADDNPDDIGPYDPKENLASQSGTLTPKDGKPLTDGKYQTILNSVSDAKTLTLEKDVSVQNDSLIEDENDETKDILVSDAVDWTKNSILKDAGYLRTGGKAVNKSRIINDAAATMTVGNASVGLAAAENSTAENLGVINVSGKNAAIGIAAGDGSKGSNLGALNLIFSDSQKSQNQIIGMYADTNSRIINNTQINGAVSNSTAGGVTGMQVNLLRYNKGTTRAVNAGELALTTDGEQTADSGISLTGMKSVADKMLDDVKEPIEAKAALVNEGSIKITNEKWKNTPSLLMTGIYADKYTDVDNKGGNIEMSTVAQNASYAIHAVDSGNITNSGNIIMNGYNDYGIYSEKNSGSLSIVNKGTIEMKSDNSVSGTAWGIYAEKAASGTGAITIENTATITIDKAEANAEAIHGKGVQQISNDATLILTANNASGIILDNENEAKGKLLFDGGIDIVSDGQAYGLQLVNGVLSGAADEKEGVEEKNKKGATGDISIKGMVPEDQPDAQIGTGVGIFMDKKSSGMNSGSIRMENLTSATGIFANKESVLTNKGDISFSATGSAVGVYADERSQVTNEAMISIEESNNLRNTGMKAGVNSVVTNTEDGSISIEGTGTGMRAEVANAGAVNKGSILVNGNGYGMAIEGLYSYGVNSGSITVGSGIGVLAGGSSFNNTREGDRVGSITVYADDAIGVKGGCMTNSGGTIDVSGDNVRAIQTSGLTTTVSISDGNVSARGKNAIGVDDSSGVLIFNLGSPATLEVNGANREDEDKSYGVLVRGGSRFSNEGKLSVSGDNSYGVRIENNTKSVNADGVETWDPSTFYNNGEITVDGDNSNGVYIYKAKEVVNDAEGKIVLNNAGIGLQSEEGELVKNLGVVQILRGKTTGSVDIDAAGFNPTAVGMDITGGEFEIGPAVAGKNGVEANVLVNSDASRGVAVHGSATGVNKGLIDVNGDYSVGIYADSTGSAGVLNQGEVRVTGDVGIGMYADGNALMINDTNGEIRVSGTNVVGMKARGAGAVIENRGKIFISGVEDTDGSSLETQDGGLIRSSTSSVFSARAFALEDGATFINSGEVAFDGDVNFNDAGEGTVMAARAGKFIGKSFVGDVTAAADITTGSNEETYVSENSFVGEDAGLNLRSASHMFGAALVENETGGLDIVMNRRNFSELTDNSSAAAFLEKNYQENNRVDLFDVLKSASGAQGFNDKLASELGMNFFPNFAKENLDVMKSLNRSLNNTILESADERDERVLAGTDNFYREKDGDAQVLGYKNIANSVYGVADKRLNGMWRYGLGASVSQVNSDYDRGSKREETVVQVFAPVMYNSSEYKLLSTLRAGYGFGNYKRKVDGKTFKADTENFYYGLTNEARKNIDAGSFAIQPTAEFNVLGIYQGKNREKNGLNVSAENNLSIEAGLGLYAVKMFEFYNKDKLNLRAGATYYHEFGDPYANIEAGMSGMSGRYVFDGYKLRRNRVVAGARADYVHDSLSLYMAANKYFEHDSGYEFNLGLEWRF